MPLAMLILAFIVHELLFVFQFWFVFMLILLAVITLDVFHVKPATNSTSLVAPTFIKDPDWADVKSELNFNNFPVEVGVLMIELLQSVVPPTVKLKFDSSSIPLFWIKKVPLVDVSDVKVFVPVPEITNFTKDANCIFNASILCENAQTHCCIIW